MAAAVATAFHDVGTYIQQLDARLASVETKLAQLLLQSGSSSGAAAAGPDSVTSPPSSSRRAANLRAEVQEAQRIATEAGDEGSARVSDAEVPVVIGYLRPLPTPVRSLHFQTQCCRCNVEGVGVRADGVEIGKTDSEGVLQLPPNRSKTCELQFSGFPTDLLPGESGRTPSTWKLPGETSEECQDRLLHCLVWIYAVPPDEEEQEEGEDTEPLDTTIWVAVNPEQIPDEAQPVRGTLTLPWTKEKQVKLDGSTTGPFPLSKVPDLPEAESHCLFARLALHCEPDGAFQFVAKDPSPLTERCVELGGCELLRLLACPVVVGYFKPIKK